MLFANNDIAENVPLTCPQSQVASKMDSFKQNCISRQNMKISDQCLPQSRYERAQRQFNPFGDKTQQIPSMRSQPDLQQISVVAMG